ncbi:MAG: hypothetical protein K8R88_03880 [Armatimonadetes bacterium]|nr:hypothetical protein [Armatimonadota bacterium]
MDIAISATVLIATLALALALSDTGPKEEKQDIRGVIGIGILALVAFLLSRADVAALADGKASLLGVAAGLITLAGFSVLPKSARMGWLIGLGCAIVGTTFLKSPILADFRWLQLGFLGGVGLGQVLLQVRSGSWMLLGSIVAVGLNFYTKEVDGLGLNFAVTTTAAAIFFAGFVAAFISKIAPSKNAELTTLFGWLVTLGIAILAIPRLLAMHTVWQAALLGVAAALVTCWLIREDEPQMGTFTLASATLWFGCSTLVTGFDRVLGLPILLATGLATCLILDRKQAAIAMSPLVAILFFRLFRLADPEALRTIDLGQNYVLGGLIVGILLSSITYEVSKTARGVAAALAGISLATLAVAAVILMGGKGSLGLIIGASLTPLFIVLNERRTLVPFASGLAVAGWVAATHPMSVQLASLDKSDKTQLLVKFFVVAAIAATAAWFVMKPKSDEVQLETV